jgi:hypothetical protein
MTLHIENSVILNVSTFLDCITFMKMALHPSEASQQLTSQHGVTFHKTWDFSSAITRMPSAAELQLFVWSHIQYEKRVRIYI